MTITPTQVDREATARIARHMCICPDGVPPRAIEEGHPAGDASSLVQAFARHAAKARAEGMEAAIEAAKAEGRREMREEEQRCPQCGVKFQLILDVDKHLSALGDTPC